jgi:very-short-patch-repair endonuclease
VRQWFGPINREVGWRRLNVLVTRAKMSMRVFTSLRPEDIKVTETSNKGLIAFRAYLNYAENGAQYDDASGGEPDSDFEVFVADAICDAGYEVVPQVGVEGFRIDLGVRHPDFPVGFIAGVECDGATYHSGMTVRDRDRIRQTVLEQMGWNIYRVWSTDWFADPTRGTAKLLSKLDEWRTALAEEYASRPETTSEEFDQAPLEDDQPEAEEPAEIFLPIEAESAPAPPAATESDERIEPTGRPMRPLDEIEWYEVRKGYLYEVWLDKRHVGQVEVLSRATAAPQVYGDQIRVARSEYEGLIEATGERFKVHDIHHAVREVARLAMAGVS